MHAIRDGAASVVRLANVSASPAAAIEADRSGSLDSDRANMYLLLASLVRKAPSDKLLQGLAVLRGDASPLGLAHLALADAARATTAEAVGREHFNLFIGVGRGEVLPYASYYLTGFLNERPLAEVREDMGRLAIERCAGVFEPEDHIGSLLEIMAGLVRGDFDQPRREADAFFKRHISPWGLRLMDDVGAAPSACFFRAVAGLGRLWLEIEREAMELPE